MVPLIGLEQLGIRACLRTHGGGEYGPAIGLLRIGQTLPLHPQAIAPLQRRWGPRGWLAPTGTARAACVGHDAIADRVRAPGAWAATAPARPLPLIGGPGSFRVRQASKPPRLPLGDVGGHRL